MRLMLPDISFEDCLHVLFSFLPKNVLLKRSHLSPLNTCHIINTSQSCLSTRKDSSWSVLIFVLYSVFLLCREVVLFFFNLFICLFCCCFFSSVVLCSAQLINTGLLFTPSFGLYWFWGSTHDGNCFSVPFVLFISFSSRQQRGFRLGMIYASP